MALTEYTGDTNYISALDDLPNDVGGLTAEQLKAVFDQFGTEFKAWFNGTHLADIDGNLPNRNILHNWDFAVNQRGVTSFSGAYGPDRWSSANGFDVYNRYIQATGASTLIQLIERGVVKAGTYTMGAKITPSTAVTFQLGFWGGTVYDSEATTSDADGYASVQLNIPSVEDFYSYVYVQVSSGVNVYSVKLELGTVSTLAKDPPADFGEQLALCQRYYYRLKVPINGVFGDGFTFASSDEFAYFLVPFMKEMRVVPTVSVSDYSRFFLAFGGVNSTVTAYHPSNNYATKINAHISFGLAAGRGVSKPCSLASATGTAFIEFSADL